MNDRIAVRATGLTKTYGEGETEVHALRDVTFEVPRGEFVVLQGASGSGKTTLLNQIGALEPPSSGNVEANGFNLNASTTTAAPTIGSSGSASCSSSTTSWRR